MRWVDSAGKFSPPSTVATGETLNLHVYVWYSFTTVDQFIQPEKFHHCRPQYWNFGFTSYCTAIFPSGASYFSSKKAGRFVDKIVAFADRFLTLLWSMPPWWLSTIGFGHMGCEGEDPGCPGWYQCVSVGVWWGGGTRVTSYIHLQSVTTTINISTVVYTLWKCNYDDKFSTVVVTTVLGATMMIKLWQS